MSLPQSAPASPVPATSSRVARVAIVLTVAILLLLRLPRTLDTVAGAMPADVISDVGDPHLVDLAVQIAAMLGVALTLGSVVIFLAVAAMLERHAPSALLRVGPLRLGAFTATVGACYLVIQVRGLLAPPTVHAGLLPVVLALGTGLLVGLGYAWGGRGSRTPRNAVVGVLATTGLALAMSVTTLSV